MLSCDDATRLIARRADGDVLDVSAAAALDSHLAGCSSCRDAVPAQRAVAELLRARPAERVSPRFHARLAKRLDDDGGWFGMADWRAWTIRLAPAAVALALAAFLTSGQMAASPISLEEWTVGSTDSSSPASVLWDSDLSSDSVLESMLGVEVPAAGGASNGR
jgi:anti-sigma factor RsiW